MKEVLKSSLQIKNFINSERAVWKLANANYEALDRVITRNIGNVKLQYNPAREVSTGANISTADIAKRPCFLCKQNRPSEQHSLERCGDYEILLNPFPIFSHHLTISHIKHIPQESDPVDMTAFCFSFPSYVAFYNGARSGASAPDHRHFQATLCSELDLIARINSKHQETIKANRPKIFCDYGVGMYVADATNQDEIKEIDRLTGIDPITGKSDRGLRNILMWKRDNNTVRMVIIPRKAHRPHNYGRGEGERLVSPGAVDMAGLIITPRRKDFDELTAKEISEIYSQTGFSPVELQDVDKFIL